MHLLVMRAVAPTAVSHIITVLRNALLCLRTYTGRYCGSGASTRGVKSIRAIATCAMCCTYNVRTGTLERKKANVGVYWRVTKFELHKPLYSSFQDEYNDMCSILNFQLQVDEMFSQKQPARKLSHWAGTHPTYISTVSHEYRYW